MPALGKDVSLTYLGHSTFLIETPGGRRVLIDPLVQSNPQCPDNQKKVASLDLILITHGHSDHMADAIPLAAQTNAPVICCFEIGGWLESKGVQNVMAMSKGGTVNTQGLRITMTHADHTSSIDDNGATLYGGEPAGLMVRLENGVTIYHAGDTALFGDMALLAALYKPDLVLLPIGDYSTMGPFEAAHACRLMGVNQVVPMHYGTFPQLSGTPEAFQSELNALGLSTNVIVLKPGETLS